MMPVMNSGMAFNCLPTTVWGREVEYEGLPVLTKTLTKEHVRFEELPLNVGAFGCPEWRVQKLGLTHLFAQPRPYIQHLLTTDGREKLERIAPRPFGFGPGETCNTVLFEVDYTYLNDLEEWRQQLRAGNMTAQKLLETGQMASFIPYLLLLGDWKALNAYFAGLLKVNVGLAVFLRASIRKLQLGDLKQMLEKAEDVLPPLELARPRPPTAPMAPPTLQSLA